MIGAAVSATCERRQHSTEWCLGWWPWWELGTSRSPGHDSERRSTRCPACEPRRWTRPGISDGAVNHEHERDKHAPSEADGRTYPRNDLGLAFFPPLVHFGINLLTHFRADLSSVSREESQEALRAAVDDVDLVQGHCVDHLFPLLQLALWTLDKLCLQGFAKWCQRSHKSAVSSRMVRKRKLNLYSVIPEHP